MKKNNGFTLIELIVVIVILGILAATSAPKFIDLQSSARIACLQGLKGAMQSANNLARSKGMVQGIDIEGTWTPTTSGGSQTDYDKTPYVELNGVRYGMNRGYIDRLYIIAWLEGGQDFQTVIINGKKWLFVHMCG